jgi:CBS-domain-containing membrane protein
MVMKWLTEHMDEMSELGEVAVSELRPWNFVSTVNQSARAITAFKRMVSEDVSGLAVVDDTNKICDVITVRDLRGIDSISTTFRWLYNTTGYFKKQVRDRDADTLAITPKAPVTMNTDATLNDLLKNYVDKWVHRVFIVNQSKNLVDVISELDVLTYILGLKTSESANDDFWGY